MSMSLEFEPHSWYKGFAINDTTKDWHKDGKGGFINTSISPRRWHAYMADGNTYRIIEVEAKTLKELKENITAFWHVRNNVPY